MFSLRLNKITSLIAILAIIFASFAPGISYALSTSNTSDTLQEVCTSNGMKLVVVDSVNLGIKSPEVPEDNKADKHLAHCLYCSNYSSDATVPNVEKTLFLATINSIHPVDIYCGPLLEIRFQVSNPPQAPPAI